MRRRARRDLRRMGHRQHLHALRQPRQPLADRVGDRAADPGVDLVEDQRRRRAAVGERHLQRQQEARQLAARRDLHHRPRPRAGIGAHPELDLVDAVLHRGCPASLVSSTMNSARSSFSAGSSAITAFVSADRRGLRALGQLCGVDCHRRRARRPPASPAPCSRSSPASRSARSATIVSRSCARSSTGTAYLRAAARSANSRSSAFSSRCGSNSVARSAASTRRLRGVERDQRRRRAP